MASLMKRSHVDRLVKCVMQHIDPRIRTQVYRSNLQQYVLDEQRRLQEARRARNREESALNVNQDKPQASRRKKGKTE